MNALKPSLIALQARLDQFARLTGHASAWLCLLLVLVTTVIVVLRYRFDIGSIALQEAATYLHASLLMLAMAYTLSLDEHVRVDIFYRNWPTKRKGLVDLIGTLLFLLPLCIALFVYSYEYVLTSWRIQEGSADAGGLPFVYALKSLLLIMPVLLALQAISEALRALLRLTGDKDQTVENGHDGEGQGWS